MPEKRKSVSEPYSAEQINKIIAAVGLHIDPAKRAELQGKLNFAAGLYRDQKNDPTPAQLRNRLRAIEKAAQKLLSALGAEQDTEPSPPVLVQLETALIELWEEESDNTGSNYQQVMRALAGVRSLQRWAAHEAAEIEKDIKPRGRSRNTARLYFAVSLAGFYEEAFGRKPRVSRDPVDSEPRGPFVRFLDACLRELGEEQSPETVAKWAKLAKNWDWGVIEITTENGRVLYSRDSSQ